MLTNCGSGGVSGGVFVVEITSSTGLKLRCVIRKGSLQHVCAPMPNGVAMRLLNHARQEIFVSSLHFSHARCCGRRGGS
jgi:hypothetical protein